MEGPKQPGKRGGRKNRRWVSRGLALTAMMIGAALLGLVTPVASADADGRDEDRDNAAQMAAKIGARRVVSRTQEDAPLPAIEESANAENANASATADNASSPQRIAPHPRMLELRPHSCGLMFYDTANQTWEHAHSARKAPVNASRIMKAWNIALHPGTVFLPAPVEVVERSIDDAMDRPGEHRMITPEDLELFPFANLQAWEEGIDGVLNRDDLRNVFDRSDASNPFSTNRDDSNPFSRDTPEKPSVEDLHDAMGKGMNDINDKGGFRADPRKADGGNHACTKDGECATTESHDQGTDDGDWHGTQSSTDTTSSDGTQEITSVEHYSDDNHEMTVETTHSGDTTTQTVTSTDKDTGETTSETSCTGSKCADSTPPPEDSTPTPDSCDGCQAPIDMAAVTADVCQQKQGVQNPGTEGGVRSVCGARPGMTMTPGEARQGRLNPVILTDNAEGENVLAEYGIHAPAPGVRQDPGNLPDPKPMGGGEPYRATGSR